MAGTAPRPVPSSSCRAILHALGPRAFARRAGTQLPCDRIVWLIGVDHGQSGWAPAGATRRWSSRPSTGPQRLERTDAARLRCRLEHEMKPCDGMGPSRHAVAISATSLADPSRRYRSLKIEPIPPCANGLRLRRRGSVVCVRRIASSDLLTILLGASTTLCGDPANRLRQPMCSSVFVDPPARLRSRPAHVAMQKHIAAGTRLAVGPKLVPSAASVGCLEGRPASSRPIASRRRGVFASKTVLWGLGGVTF